MSACVFLFIVSLKLLYCDVVEKNPEIPQKDVEHINIWKGFFMIIVKQWNSVKQHTVCSWIREHTVFNSFTTLLCGELFG